MRRLPIAALAVLCGLVACAPPDFPEDRVFAEGDALTIPALAPLDDLASAMEPGDGEATTTALQGRGERLRARADALRGTTP